MLAGITILDLNAELGNYIIRIIIAAVCGFAIGFERKTRSKEAGVRTHTIVSLGAALLMVISKYGFEGDTDSARIAAQIVSGIGFLGAGIIFYRRDILHGLTTAAGMWATAGIGMAAGAGLIMTALLTTVLIIAFQVILHRPWKILKTRMITILKLTVRLDEPETVDKICYIFSSRKFLKFKTTTTENGIFADIELTSDRTFTAKEIYEIASEHEFIKTLEKTDEL